MKKLFAVVLVLVLMTANAALAYEHYEKQDLGCSYEWFEDPRVDCVVDDWSDEGGETRLILTIGYYYRFTYSEIADGERVIGTLVNEVHCSDGWARMAPIEQSEDIERLSNELVSLIDDCYDWMVRTEGA